uniref:Uncharacterized protein n=1 Tax=Chromera velia CCMP2878 TaxID=1169474 RepID=A0A0G4GVL9_9ALVE|eukprot:Cvel_5276.t1-p1 / transcript=Cvel_5276.t1 / gene=Cvel_5276 / organism=Chromera_velia_CCMP2878 / gene_product=hypothetical protein / transcript_product=hypothetical protein / location=Cvel_scaffold243:106520-109080(-) / protein_length=615 / sequence_SO=supercontig / SO=protein_coding / is_pseudo=false
MSYHPRLGTPSRDKESTTADWAALAEVPFVFECDVLAFLGRSGDVFFRLVCTSFNEVSVNRYQDSPLTDLVGVAESPSLLEWSLGVSREFCPEDDLLFECARRGRTDLVDRLSSLPTHFSFPSPSSSSNAQQQPKKTPSLEDVRALFNLLGVIRGAAAGEHEDALSRWTDEWDRLGKVGGTDTVGDLVAKSALRHDRPNVVAWLHRTKAWSVDRGMVNDFLAYLSSESVVWLEREGLVGASLAGLSLSLAHAAETADAETIIRAVESAPERPPEADDDAGARRFARESLDLLTHAARGGRSATMRTLLAWLRRRADAQDLDGHSMMAELAEHESVVDAAAARGNWETVSVLRAHSPPFACSEGALSLISAKRETESESPPPSAPLSRMNSVVFREKQKQQKEREGEAVSFPPSCASPLVLRRTDTLNSEESVREEDVMSDGAACLPSLLSMSTLPSLPAAQSMRRIQQKVCGPLGTLQEGREETKEEEEEGVSLSETEFSPQPSLFARKFQRALVAGRRLRVPKRVSLEATGPEGKFWTDTETQLRDALSFQRAHPWLSASGVPSLPLTGAIVPSLQCKERNTGGFSFTLWRDRHTQTERNLERVRELTAILTQN